MTKRARAKRAETGPISNEWEVEDHLTAVRARIDPLNTISTDILNADIKVYQLLWPDSPRPFSIAELARCLLSVEEKLREWRSSSARAGADQALTFVLSWYETININTVRSLRDKSMWTSDPMKIQDRQAAADFMAGYAETR